MPPTDLDGLMPNLDQPPERAESKRLRLFLYLIPIVGFGPALWCLYRQQGDRREQQVSRQVVVIGVAWAAVSLLLTCGAGMGEMPALPLLVILSGVTSTYFLVHLWLMVQLGRHQSLEVPGITAIGERLP